MSDRTEGTRERRTCENLGMEPLMAGVRAGGGGHEESHTRRIEVAGSKQDVKEAKTQERMAGLARFNI